MADAIKAHARRPHRCRRDRAAHRPRRLQRRDPHHLRRRPCWKPATPRTRCRRRARATVNCRILPDQPVEEVARTLARVIADDKVKIIPKGDGGAEPAVADQSRNHAGDRGAQRTRCGRACRSSRSCRGGYTDSRWLRNAGIPVYGVSGLFSDPAPTACTDCNEQVGVKDALRQQGISLPAGQAAGRAKPVQPALRRHP